jgi:hypothetical protein
VRFGVVDKQPGGIVGSLAEGERRVLVGRERAVAVERDAPCPAQNADVEVEDAARVAAGEEQREERHDRQDEIGEPEKDETDEVRDREQPLDEPEPAAQLRRELTFDTDGIRHGLLLVASRAPSHT